jgi:hypothetical protein
MYKIYHRRVKMNKMAFTFKFFVVFGSIFLFFGCASTIPFTNEILGEIEEGNITSFQYYISTGILLAREEESGSSNVTRGKAVISRSNQKDEIVIDPSTLCLVVEQLHHANDDYFWIELKVGFEQLADGSIPTISFTTVSNPTEVDKYYLWYDGSDNTLLYNGNWYSVTLLDGRELGNVELDERPYLNIKIKTSDRQLKNRRKVTGLKVN